MGSKELIDDLPELEKQAFPKWYARKDLAGKTRQEIRVILLNEDLASVTADGNVGFWGRVVTPRRFD